MLKKFFILVHGSISYIKWLGLKAFVSKVFTYTKNKSHRERENLDYAEYLKFETRDIKKKIKEMYNLKYLPLISFIMPTYNTPVQFLDEAINSIYSQIYKKWEIIIYDDGSTSQDTINALKKIKGDNIRIYFSKQNNGISNVTNNAVKYAKGEYLAFLDHDDTLAKDALFEVVKALNTNRKIDYLYSDEDKLNEKGERIDPFFKPDFSLYLLLTCMYLAHFRVMKKSLFNDVGGYLSIYDGAQDWDIALRFYERHAIFYHIPKILYHWRISPSSTAKSIYGAKSYAIARQKLLLEAFLERNNIVGKVSQGFWFGSCKVFMNIVGNPSVEIIIPIRDNVKYLKKCIDSISNKTSYNNYHITIVDNNSCFVETLDYLKKISKNKRINIIKYINKFNYSNINNIAVKSSTSDYVLFLNNDTEVITTNWMEEMLSLAQMSNVGAVGALLLYKDNTVQHAGVIIGLGGIAGHSHKGWVYPSNGYNGAITSIRNYSAVTAACLMVSRNKFNEIGGFDESYNVVYSDVDLCLKLNSKGYGTVYTPYARLFHYESKTREKHRYENDFDIDIFMKKWHNLLITGDPYYNPNLSLVRERDDFSMKKLK